MGSCEGEAAIGAREQRRTSWRVFHGPHFREEGFGGDVLFVGPGYGAKQGADLVEVGDLAQLAEDAVIQVGLQIEDPLAPVLDLHVDLEIGERLDLLHVPVHVRLRVVQSYRGFRR